MISNGLRFLVWGLLITLQLTQATKKGPPAKVLKCPYQEIDAGCKCMTNATAAQLMKVIGSYRRWMITAKAGHYANLKQYAKAWSAYEAYMRVSKHCKSMAMKTARAFNQYHGRYTKKRNFLRRCSVLRRKLRRSIGYKKRLQDRLHHLKKKLDFAEKTISEMTAKIKKIENFVNDSCRFMVRVFTFKKSVAWVISHEVRHQQEVLNRLYKPLLRTLKKQRKEHTGLCKPMKVIFSRRVRMRAKWKAYKLKRLHMRFKRCAEHAYYFAHLQVQNHMLVAKHKAQEATEMEHRYHHKLIMGAYRLCVREHGFDKCKRSELMFKRYDTTEKKWKKIAKKLKHEFPGIVRTFQEWLPKEWKHLKAIKLQKRLEELYKLQHKKKT